MMKRSTAIAAVVLAALATPLAAQAPGDLALTLYDVNLRFFAALVAGVLLAAGFQIILTSLVTALGISAIGDVEKKVHEPSTPDTSEASGERPSSTLVKVSNGLGIGVTVTSALSLFFATWLAVSLSLAILPFTGLVIGLSIWAAFFALTLYLDTRVAATLLGGVARAAGQGLRLGAQGVGAVGSAFSASPEKRMEKVADHTIHELRREISDMLDRSKFDKKLDSYVKKLSPPEFDYKRARKEMEKLLDDLSVHERDEADEGGLDRDTFVSIASRHRNVSKRDVSRLGEIFDELKAARQEGTRPSEQALRGVERVSGGDDGIRRKVEDYLRKTGREELDPESLKEDLDRIISDPGATPQVVMDRIRQIDRNSVVAALAQRDDMDEQRADEVVSHVEKALNFIRERIGGARQRGQEARVGMGEKARGGTGLAASVGQEVEARVEGYLASLQRPELDYNSIKSDVETIFHDRAQRSKC
jgi:hypothetical protein